MNIQTGTSLAECARAFRDAREALRALMPPIMPDAQALFAAVGTVRVRARETIGECEWCGRFDHHLVEGECEHCRGISIELRAIMNQHLEGDAPATCVFCDCTDTEACWDPDKGAPCHWLFVDRELGIGVCSACREEQLRYAPLIRYLRERQPLRAAIAATDARPAA